MRNLLLAALSLNVATLFLNAGSAADLQKAHTEAVNRQRRIIYNNDGNEPIYLCRKASAQDLLSHRLAPVAGTHVDTISYCTWSSGFGVFTHLTKVGAVFTTREGRFTNNLMPEFVARGLDPLKIVVDFARSNHIEIFWSMRMNDTHDASAQDYGPVMFKANPLKLQHPEYLMGAKDRRPKYGTWSAVDYGHSEIRDLAFRYCEEVCRNYDIDGLELDFFRHAFFFKRSSLGEPCAETQWEQMTGLIRRIRQMTRAVAAERKKPLLIAVRVPDSTDYCRWIGLDVERWLTDGLVDLLVVSGYTQLNPWQYSVELARKHGVKVYPSLDESRLRNEGARAMRSTFEAYRGRALNVWASGADGVYMFNYFTAPSPLWSELGDPKTLVKLPRDYFVTVRGVGAMPVPHRNFLRVPILEPGQALTLANEPVVVEFQTGERAGESSGVATPPRALLQLRVGAGRKLDHVQVALNGVKLAGGEPIGEWMQFPVPWTALRTGNNTLKLVPPRTGAEKVILSDLRLQVLPGTR